MKTSFEQYTRLAKSFLGMSSLWMGRDHIVYVKGEGFLQAFTEEYRRYRYRDIQAFTITRISRWGSSLLYLLGILFFVGILLLIVNLRDEGGMGPITVAFLSLFAAGGLLFGFFLIRNWVLGPRCTCDIQTSLKRDRLRPLTRVNQAKESIDRITGLIEEAQESLKPKDADDAEGDSRAVSLSATRPDAVRMQVPAVVLPTFGIFAILGILGLAGTLMESPILILVVFFLGMIGAIGLIISLVQSFRAVVPEVIRLSLWVVLGSVFVLTGAAFIYLIYASARNPVYSVGVGGPLNAFAAMATEAGVGFFSIIAGGLLILSLVASAGVWQSVRWRQRLGMIDQQPTPNGEEPPAA